MDELFLPFPPLLQLGLSGSYAPACTGPWRLDFSSSCESLMTLAGEEVWQRTLVCHHALQLWCPFPLVHGQLGLLFSHLTTGIQTETEQSTSQHSVIYSLKYTLHITRRKSVLLIKHLDNPLLTAGKSQVSVLLVRSGCGTLLHMIILQLSHNGTDSQD